MELTLGLGLDNFMSILVSHFHRPPLHLLLLLKGLSDIEWHQWLILFVSYTNPKICCILYVPTYTWFLGNKNDFDFH